MLTGIHSLRSYTGKLKMPDTKNFRFSIHFKGSNNMGCWITPHVDLLNTYSVCMLALVNS